MEISASELQMAASYGAVPRETVFCAQWRVTKSDSDWARLFKFSLGDWQVSSSRICTSGSPATACVTMFRGKQEQGNVQLNSKHYYSFKLFLFNTSLILCGNFDCLHVQKATSALSLGQRHADPILPLYVCGVEVFYLQNTEYFIDPVTGNHSVISQDIKIYIYIYF